MKKILFAIAPMIISRVMQRRRDKKARGNVQSTNRRR